MNRRTLENEIRVLMRQTTTFALAIADLDSFKQLNDTLGHEAGDRSLRVFAQLVRRVLRDVDLVGRWGGEEFVIVMPGTDCSDAVGVLERARASAATPTVPIPHSQRASAWRIRRWAKRSSG